MTFTPTTGDFNNLDPRPQPQAQDRDFQIGEYVLMRHTKVNPDPLMGSLIGRVRALQGPTPGLCANGQMAQGAWPTDLLQSNNNDKNFEGADVPLTDAPSTEECCLPQKILFLHPDWMTRCTVEHGWAPDLCEARPNEWGWGPDLRAADQLTWPRQTVLRWLKLAAFEHTKAGQQEKVLWKIPPDISNPMKWYSFYVRNLRQEIAQDMALV